MILSREMVEMIYFMEGLVMTLSLVELVMTPLMEVPELMSLSSRETNVTIQFPKLDDAEYQVIDNKVLMEQIPLKIQRH